MADEIGRGEYAGGLLENTMFREVMETIEADCFNRWKNSPAQDTAGREKIWDYLAALRMVRTELEVIRDNGIAMKARRDDEARNERFNALNRIV